MSELDWDEQYRQMFISRLDSRNYDPRYGGPSPDKLVSVWDDKDLSPEQKTERMRELVAEDGKSRAVALYFTSVIYEHAGTGRAVSWDEACNLIGHEQAQIASAHYPWASVPEDPWAAVQKAHHEVAQPAAAAPGRAPSVASASWPCAQARPMATSQQGPSMTM